MDIDKRNAFYLNLPHTTMTFFYPLWLFGRRRISLCDLMLPFIKVRALLTSQAITVCVMLVGATCAALSMHVHVCVLFCSDLQGFSCHLFNRSQKNTQTVVKVNSPMARCSTHFCQTDLRDQQHF